MTTHTSLESHHLKHFGEHPVRNGFRNMEEQICQVCGDRRFRQVDMLHYGPWERGPYCNTRDVVEKTIASGTLFCEVHYLPASHSTSPGALTFHEHSLYINADSENMVRRHQGRSEFQCQANIGRCLEPDDEPTI